MSKQILFSKNLEKGRIAEIIAKEDYKNHGFKVTKTGIGSDFMVEKTTLDGEIYKELVEVKAGNAQLSKRQRITKRGAKGSGVIYTQYTVSDIFIENYLKENSIAQVPKFELMELIPENWSKNDNYKIALPCICPHCGISVTSLDEIISKFGLRKMEDDTIRNQSWCRKCRSNSFGLSEDSLC